ATPEFKTYARQIVANARTLAASLTAAGLRVVSGGTDNHLMLVDVRPMSLTGKQAEKALDAVGITVNKNTIPYDPQKPGIASGIRIGTPAITTRGMKEAEMERIGALIGRILQAKGDETVAKDVAAEVLDLTRRYPVPGLTPDKGRAICAQQRSTSRAIPSCGRSSRDCVTRRRHRRSSVSSSPRSPRSFSMKGPRTCRPTIARSRLRLLPTRGRGSGTRSASYRCCARGSAWSR